MFFYHKILIIINMLLVIIGLVFTLLIKQWGIMGLSRRKYSRLCLCFNTCMKSEHTADIGLKGLIL